MKPIKREAGRMKLDYLQFRARRFTRLAPSSKPGMQQRIRCGRLLRSIPARTAFDPHRPLDQLAWLIAWGNESLLDDLEDDALRPGTASGCAKAPPPPTSFSTARATSGSSIRGWFASPGARA